MRTLSSAVVYLRPEDPAVPPQVAGATVDVAGGEVSVVTRPDVGLVVLAPRYAGGPERQGEAADAVLAA